MQARTVHALQTLFASAEAETAWVDHLRMLIEQARFDEAEAILAAEIATLDADMARLCQAAPREAVEISGWPELAERIELHEGELPITGLTLAIGNDGDLDFEKGKVHAPYMMLGLYTDEAWHWSGATREVLLAECSAEDGPGWAGTDEDLEAFLEISGLSALNTALIHSKQRHFIREGDVSHAPVRYVEFVVGSWWRALRFHQAVADAQAAHPLPGRVTIVSGMVDMRPDVVSVHLPDAAPAVQAAAAAEASPMAMAPLAFAVDDDDEEPAEEIEAEAEVSVINLITRKPIEEEKPLSGADLRRRFHPEPANDAGAEAGAAPEPKRGFFARMFGRR
jgi:hypothetical protein